MRRGLFVFHIERNADGNCGKGDGGVSKSDCSDLVAAAADSRGAFLHGGANQPAYGESHVANHDSSKNGEGGIDDQSGDGAADAEEDAAHEGGVRVLWQTRFDLLGAAFAGQYAVDAIVVAAEDLFAASAGFCAGVLVFGSAELRDARAGIRHGASEGIRND